MSKTRNRKPAKRGKLKIAHIHWAFPPTTGGADAHLIMLLPELARRGHEVSLLTGSTEGGRVYKDYIGISVRRESIMDLDQLNERGLAEMENETRQVIKSFLNKARPDIVHAHNMNYFSKIHARVLEEEARKRKIPLILTAHNSWNDILFLELTKKIQWDHIIATSFYTKKELMGMGGSGLGSGR